MNDDELKKLMDRKGEELTEKQRDLIYKRQEELRNMANSITQEPSDPKLREEEVIEYQKLLKKPIKRRTAEDKERLAILGDRVQRDKEFNESIGIEPPKRKKMKIRKPAGFREKK